MSQTRTEASSNRPSSNRPRRRYQEEEVWIPKTSICLLYTSDAADE